jgi:hypothetical protein
MNEIEYFYCQNINCKKKGRLMPKFDMHYLRIKKFNYTLALCSACYNEKTKKHKKTQQEKQLCN